MTTIEIIAAVCLLVFGIANQIIDYKHRKRKACEPGCAWQYYSQLAREAAGRASS